jgi:D-alanyl-D-alanine carboxypeptidase/D-alanyl-D-alanine-endopeptidase (penicillin-binding protein 4)
MFNWRIAAIVALSISITACSSQPTEQQSAGVSGAYSDDVINTATARQPSRAPRQQQENYASNRANSAPTQLSSSGGEKTYRGNGKFNQLPDSIAASLRLRGLAEQNMGVYVRPVNGGQPILTAYSDTPRNPASTMKLVTTYTALGVLGGDYRWPTEIYTTGNLAGDTLQGDVIIKGYGDPDFRESGFRELLQALRARGIRNIAGNFVIDKTYFNVQNQGTIDGAEGAAYNAEPEALLYGEWGSCYNMPGKAGQVQRICRLAPRNARDLNANLFADFWRIWNAEMGGNLGGGLQIGAAPQGAQLVQTHHSAPLREIIKEINKDSNNVMARQVLLSVGAKQLGAPGTTQKGAAAVGQWLESRGLRFSNLRIENGSGLSRSERISAREMGEMLVDIYNSPYRSDMLNSMATIGMEGTVKKRMTNLAGRGKFKTGTLKNVKALAGFITAANGLPYVVSILHNDPRAPGARDIHDDLVEWVYYGSNSNFASR